MINFLEGMNILILLLLKVNKDLTGKTKSIKIHDCNYNKLFGELISKPSNIEYAA